MFLFHQVLSLCTENVTLKIYLNKHLQESYMMLEQTKSLSVVALKHQINKSHLKLPLHWYSQFLPVLSQSNLTLIFVIKKSLYKYNLFLLWNKETFTCTRY